MNKGIFFILILATNVLNANSDKPYRHILEDNVDVIEINHLCLKGNKEFVEFSYHQLIFWEWDGFDYVVVDWRMLQRDGNVYYRNKNEPFYDFDKCKYVTQFIEEVNGVNYLRKIYCTTVNETWTYTDPETNNKEIMPSVFRKGLSLPLKINF